MNQQSLEFGKNTALSITERHLGQRFYFSGEKKLFLGRLNGWLYEDSEPQFFGIINELSNFSVVFGLNVLAEVYLKVSKY